MAQRYENLKIGSLANYFTPKKFRTVTATQSLNVAPGVSEIKVEIQCKKRMKNILSFRIPWDGVVYACARGKEELKAKLKTKKEIEVAYLVDWEDKFLFVVQLEGKEELPVMFVKTEDVTELLENCWRVPEQR